MGRGRGGGAWSGWWQLWRWRWEGPRRAVATRPWRPRPGGGGQTDGAREPNVSNGVTGVGQSGAQDFGRFRSIAAAGQVPAPNTLDVVGFFNEHKLEFPAPDCGATVCAHGLFGVGGNMLDGANRSVAMLGFNTAIDPADHERMPLNMAVAVDTSSSMAGELMEAVRAGLYRLIEELDPDDILTLVTYSTGAEVLVVSTPEEDPEREALRAAVASLEADGSTNIYAGLRTALEEVSGRLDAARQNRVILLSDGLATEGLVNRDRIVNLGRAYATEHGIGITTVGVGDEFDVELMRRLSEVGPGNFYFLESPEIVEEVFRREIQTFLVPLARDVQISFEVSPAYQFRAAYGTRIWEGDAGGAEIYIPGLFMASRQTVDDIGLSGDRRGGGGAILFEVVPTSDEALLAETAPGAPVATIRFAYHAPDTGEEVVQQLVVTNPLPPGETPTEGRFDSLEVEKAFVMLNIYLGLKTATERYAHGAAATALAVLLPLIENTERWLEDHDDEDIAADLEVLEDLAAAIGASGLVVR